MNDDSPEGALARADFEVTRDAQMRRYEWNFAIKYAGPISKDATVPVWRFAGRYRLPSDWLRVLEVNGDRDGDQWEVNAGWLLTDIDDGAGVTIRYIYRNLVYSDYDPNFIDVLAYALAEKWAVALNESAAMKKEMGDSYREAVIVARASDAFEQQSRPVDVIGLIDAR
jgi:hypothetical protein